MAVPRVAPTRQLACEPLDDLPTPGPSRELASTNVRTTAYATASKEDAMNQPPGGGYPPGPPYPGQPQQGYPQQGHPQQQGYPQQGYPQQGYPQQGPPAKKSKALLIIGCGAVALLFVIGGSVGGYFFYQGQKTEKLIDACQIGAKGLESDSSSSDTDSFMKLLSITLEACSGACDREDAESCAALDKHLAKLCGVDSSICTKLCSTANSPSLKKSTCAHK